VDAKRDAMEWDNAASRSVVIDWFVLGEDELTQFEKQQLDYDGRVTMPAEDLTLVTEAA
jgi:hypothetical protein